MVFGIVCTTLLVLADWLSMPLALSDGVEYGAGSLWHRLWALVPHHETAKSLLALLASLLCACSGVLFAESSSARGNETRYPSWSFFMVTLFFGFAHASIMAAIVGLGGGQKDWVDTHPISFWFIPVLVYVLFAIALIRRVDAFRSGLVAFGVGMLIQNGLSRIYDIYAPSTFSFHAIMGSFACLAFGVFVICEMIATRRQRRSQPDTSSQDEWCCQALQLCNEASLTDRERSAVMFLLEGKSSQATAAEMNVSASTVRTYLQRAYRKLKISNSTELHALLNSHQDSLGEKKNEGDAERTICTDEVQPSYAENDRLAQGMVFGSKGIPTMLPVASFGASAYLLATLFLPGIISAGGWGTGSEMVFGGGYAFVAWSAMVLFCASPSRKPVRSRCSLFTRLLPAIAGILLLGSLFVLFASEIKLARDGSSSDIQLFISSFIFVWSLSSVLFVAATRGSFDVAKPCSYALSMLCALFLALFSSWKEPILYLSVFVASVVLIAMIAYISAYRYTASESTQNHAVLKRRDSRLAFGFAIPLLIGFACEESWRALSGPSAFDLLIPPLLLVCVLCASFLFRRTDKRSQKILLALLGVGALCSFIPGISTNPLLCATCSLCVWSFMELKNCGVLDRAYFIANMVCLGAIGVIGAMGMNSYYDHLMLNEVAMQPFASKEQVELAGIVFMVFMEAALCISVIIFSRHMNRVLFQNQFQNLVDSEVATVPTRERIRAYLRSRGLNETQASILLGIIEGQTSSEIEASLHYSKGTVKSSRAIGYRLLSIKSKHELIETVACGIGIDMKQGGFPL